MQICDLFKHFLVVSAAVNGIFLMTVDLSVALLNGLLVAEQSFFVLLDDIFGVSLEEPDFCVRAWVLLSYCLLSSSVYFSCVRGEVPC